MLRYLLLPLIFSVSLFSMNQVDLDKVMSPSERQKTGVSKLSPQQKHALENWITAWTMRLLNTSPVSTNSHTPNSPYTSHISNSLTIKNVYNAGNEIELSNGSMWKIYPIDVGRASSWLPRDSIEISGSANMYFPFQLRNTKTMDVIKAQKLSSGTEEEEKEEVKEKTKLPKEAKSWGSYGNLKIISLEEGGRMLSLSDQTTWLIAPNDRYTSRDWYTGDSVTIENDPSSNPTYPYIIELTSKLASVRAKSTKNSQQTPPTQTRD